MMTHMSKRAAPPGAGADKRSSQRHPVEIAGVLASEHPREIGWGSVWLEGKVVNVSRGGCLFVADKRVLIPRNLVMEMTTEFGTVLHVIALRWSNAGLHCRFMNPEIAMKALRGALASTHLAFSAGQAR